MNHPQPFTEDQIEPLVRAALEADGRGVDLARMLATIEARLADGPQVSPAHAPRPAGLSLPLSRAWAVRGGVALAACLLMAAGLATYFAVSPVPASAYSIVESAHTALAPSADRCYRVDLEKLPSAWSFLTDGDQTLVWTRGDRFRVTSSQHGHELVWGQDEQERTWVVFDKKFGLVYEKHEVPKPLAATFAYLSLDVRLLTGQILEDFDLELDQGFDRRQRELVTVHAKIKKARTGYTFHSAELDIDPTSKKILHMVLSQFHGSAERGRFEFSLVAEDPQSAESYELEAYLDEDAQVLGRQRARERNRKLMELVRILKASER
ncbi:MAG: hypothetical protein KF708_23585 [Pirellulales bacterium]|nr:hypothetical protein [Pirellulales bacterium]